jgi:hypothetical protein
MRCAGLKPSVREIKSFFFILPKGLLFIKGGIYFGLNPKKGHNDNAVEWDVYSWVYIFTRSSSLHDH